MIPPEYMNQIVTGDARELAKRIPDESVDLVFTDPVYDRIEDYEWLAETAMRVLKPDSACLVWCGTEGIANVLQAMTPHIKYKWLIVFNRPAMRTMIGPVLHRYLPLLWFEKGKKWHPIRDVFNDSLPPDAARHRWQKNPKMLLYYINRCTPAGGVVYDPFTGGGTVPAVCKMLGRNFIASEIDLVTAERARERVAMTQPPLFVLTEEQATMEVGA